VLAFLCALLAALVLFNVLVTRHFWRPYLGELDDKVVRLDQLADKVEVLFIGTSHVDFAVDPFIFDATAKEAGRPTFSYNSAVQDLRAPERTHLISQIRKLTLPRLQYVLVEPTLNHTPDLELSMTPRMRFAYNWSTVPVALRVKLDAKRPLVNRVGSSLAILREFGLSLGNLGVLSDLFVPFTNGETPQVDKLLRGYVGDILEPGLLHPSEAVLRSWRELDREKLFAGTGSQPPAREMTASELGALRTLFDDLRQLHAQPVAFIPPQSWAEADQVEAVKHALAEHFPEIPVLSYNYVGPDELYDHPEWWVDLNHLSQEGSRYFSARLARDWLALDRIPRSGPHE